MRVAAEFLKKTCRIHVEQVTSLLTDSLKLHQKAQLILHEKKFKIKTQIECPFEVYDPLVPVRQEVVPTNWSILETNEESLTLPEAEEKSLQASKLYSCEFEWKVEQPIDIDIEIRESSDVDSTPSNSLISHTKKKRKKKWRRKNKKKYKLGIEYTNNEHLFTMTELKMRSQPRSLTHLFQVIFH